MSTVETTPDRLIVALTAAGWVEVGRRVGAHVRLRYADHEPSLVVPRDPTAPEHEAMMGAVLLQLERLAQVGLAADRALTEATCSCGGRRWVDDENWQPEQWEFQRGRRRGSGLIPCGNCNHGGWDAPVGAT
jgi:predicted RNA binding protein YcfA (HicA-like mRNA interferase family)